MDKRRNLVSETTTVSPVFVLPADTGMLRRVCRQWNIRKLAVFGSALGADFRPQSDVDLLVTFEEGKTPGLDVFQLEQALSDLFGGRPVDLVSEKFLNPRLKDGILSSAKVLYEK